VIHKKREMRSAFPEKSQKQKMNSCNLLVGGDYAYLTFKRKDMKFLKHPSGVFQKRWLIKSLLIMKLTFIIVLISCIQVSAKSYSQKVTVNLKSVNLKKALSTIEKHSDFRFLYSERKIDNNDKVNINVTDADISQVMDELLAGTGLSYKELGNNLIVLIQKNEVIQDVIVKGKITDKATGKPLAGASIQIKGSKAGTTTDANGNYSINVPAKATLIVSSVDYKKTEIAVNGQTVINISLEVSTEGLNEVVVVGYGTVKKENALGAVSSIDSKEIENIPNSNLSNVLAGRLSGTYVESNTGTPGISSSIRIRAQTSWNSQPPIYVIDGVVRDETSFDALNPNEVANITVLKDAASTAIYGSRAAGGVMLITTKSGQAGKPVISFSTVVTQSQPEKLPEYLSVPASIALDRASNGDSSVTAEDVAYLKQYDPNGMAWYDAAYQNPSTRTYSLSASGGGKMITYFMSGSYYYEHGFLPNVWYEKYNIRGKISAKLSKNLTVDLNLAESNGNRNTFNFSYQNNVDLSGLWGKLFYDVSGFANPFVDGHPVNPGWLGNTIAFMTEGGYWKDKSQLNDALVNIIYKIPSVPGLSLKVSYSGNLDGDHIKSFAKQQVLYNYKQISLNDGIDPNDFLSTSLSGDPGTPYLGNSQANTNSYQLNGQINYDRHFGKSHIDAVAVYEQYESNYNYFSYYDYGFPLVPIDQYFATSSNPDYRSVSGNERQDGRLSYVGRVDYRYADKYLITIAAREDGSIAFAPNKRWGFFPSVSAGWIISNENFFKGSKASNIIDFLKLRGSFGSTGNDDIAAWQWEDHYDIGGGYYVGGSQQPGLEYAGTPNPNITWERTDGYNAGFDLDFLKNFSFTTNFWFNHTYDILGARILALPTSFGGSLPAVNYGIVNGKGLEIDLRYKNKIGQFSYSIMGNIGLAYTTVEKEDVAANAPAFANPNGKPLGYLSGYVETGIYRTQADLDKLPAGFTISGQAPVLGMLAYKDISGPGGKPDGTIDSYDQAKIANYGQAQAPVSYGLNLNFEYKGVTLEALFAGLAGFDAFYNDAFARNVGVYLRQSAWWKDYYTATNVNSKMPKPFTWWDSRADYLLNSTFNMYNGSFVRLKNLSIGYNLPARWDKKVGVSSVNIFASGTNLLLISKFKLYDPELYSQQSYPTMSTFSIGGRITL